ncbi:MAG: peptidase E [Actinomycetota bacterium]|nr:peptidase E [Actinomycetota bacterium]
MATHLIAIGGGGFSARAEPSQLDAYALSLANKPAPTVCFLPTASGDAAGDIERFHAAFRRIPCEPYTVDLYHRDTTPLSATLEDVDVIYVATLEDVDVIYVGGGSTANLISLWRLHGLDTALSNRAAARSLVVVGVSAGALCWFDGGITDSFGPLVVLQDGLRWVSGSFCPHYDSEADRRPTFHRAIRRQELAAGYAADDDAALHFIDGALHASLAERRDARTYSVGRGNGGVIETPHHMKILS